MGVTYQRLASPGIRPAARATRAWALLRWAAVRLGCAARRRWCARARRLAWAGLCCARRSGRSSAAAAVAVAGYDSASYARNFDDGAWKADEGLSWSATASGGGALAHHASASNATAATGDSVPSSSV